MAGDNFWDQFDPRNAKPVDPHAAAVPAADPPPASEDDYGADATNVVPLKPHRKRKDTHGGGGGNDGAPPGDGGEGGWRGQWQTTDTGSPLPNLLNTMVVLRHYEGLNEAMAFDQMAYEPVIIKHLPSDDDNAQLPRPVAERDFTVLQEDMQRLGLRRVNRTTVVEAALLRAHERPFHPVRDYLRGLTWDGETRLDGWLSRYLGVEGGPYVDKIGRLFLVAMVARIMRPGCKSDYMLILEGDQGAFKSTACAILAGEWFSDNLPDLGGGDPVRLSMHIRGKWLIEIGELSAFSAAEVEDLKAFLSRQHEKFTPKYGRFEVKEPRTTLFIGTTNETAYLKDSTGGRRFWPVKVGEIALDALRADRDQLFAEAVRAFDAGEPWHPTKDFEAEFIKPEQAQRYEEDVWQAQVENWLNANQRWRVRVSEVMRDALNLPNQAMSMREQKRVGAILRQLKWKKNYHHYENQSRRQPSFDV